MKEAGEQEITLKFDGEDIAMMPFVEEMIKGSILGMMRSLKGYEEGCEVSIEIK